MRRGRFPAQPVYRISLGVLIAHVALSGAGFAQTSFFHGNTVTIIQSSAPGGVGDMRTKALVPFLHKHIPGNPTILMPHRSQTCRAV